MPQTPHIEKHFLASNTVRDVIIGMSDGLTVPFALAAGLSGAVDSSSVIVVAGCAELVAGAISMGLGGYMAALNDADHYSSERKREYQEIQQIPEQEKQEVRDMLASYGLTAQDVEPMIQRFVKQPDAWVSFMMRYELGLEEPDSKRAPKSAATIAASYAGGGMIPLMPYFFYVHPHDALLLSVLVTLLALLIFGFIKSRLVGAGPFQGAFRTAVIGSLAAGAAYLIAHFIG